MLNKIYRFFYKLFTTECPKCIEGRVSYSHEGPFKHTTVSIYQCDKCGVELI